jgi:predicted transcriptional regulator
MDLQTRKLNLIEHLIRLQDEKTFRKIEEIVNKSLTSDNKILKRLTKKELMERAKKSNADYQAGHFKTQEQLEADSKNW